MSKIDKLSILGIRSFDNTRNETIQFNTPLTLIVGHNGSGKTTIIECLKYATTGEMPPNSRGGAFIHDPQLAGEKEVLAQVKLSFKAISGARMVATRSMQLSVKKATRSQKTLEGQLMMQKDGERTSLSSRVAELDHVIPQYLGVSKAILESVIFCHQDDSLWPLSEPAALKKRFDEIFEALKYTKAIENIKQLRKKQNEELAKFKIIEQHAKEDKTKADKAQQQSILLARDIENLREETITYHAKAVEAAEKAQESIEAAAQYSEKVETLKMEKSKAQWYEDHLESLRKDLKEKAESDEDLQAQLASFQSRDVDYLERSQLQESTLLSIQNNLRSTKSKQDQKRLDVGRYEERRKLYLLNIDRRSETIQHIAKARNFRGYSNELEDRDVESLMKKMGEQVKTHANQLALLKGDNARNQTKLQDKLDGVREERSRAQEFRRQTKEMLELNDSKISELTQEDNSIAVDVATVEIQRQSLKDKQANLQIIRAKRDAVKSESRMREQEASIARLDDKVADLNGELVRATRQAGHLAKLDHIRSEVRSRQQALDTTLKLHGQKISELFGHPYEMARLEPDFAKVIARRRADVKDAEQLHEVEEKKFQLIVFQLQTKQDERTQILSRLSQYERELKDAIGIEPKDFPEYLSSLEADRDTRREDVNSFDVLQKWYGDCLKSAKGNPPACRLCSRVFDDVQSAGQFIGRLEQRLSGSVFAGLQTELATLETDLIKARGLSAAFDNWERLSEEKPVIDKRIADLESDKAEMRNTMQDLSHRIQQNETQLSTALELGKAIDKAVRYLKDIKDFESQLLSFESTRDELGFETGRAIDQVQLDLEETNEEIRNARNILKQSQKKYQDLQDQTLSIGHEVNEMSSKLAQAEHNLDRHAEIIANIAKARDETLRLKAAILDSDRQLESLAAVFQDAQGQIDVFREEAQIRERETQEYHTNFLRDLQNLERIGQEIRAFEVEGSQAQLEKVMSEIVALDADIASLEGKSSEVLREMAQLKDELANHEEISRVIRDNLKYRQTARDLADSRRIIDELQHLNAESDQARHHEEAKKWQKASNMYQIEETSKMGTMKAKDDQLMQLLNDWELDHKDAASKYKRAHIEVETTKAAIEDLGRYGSALDKAIMRYHSLKMEEINRIVEELWKCTYRGTDVDKIMIRSDNESGKGNRSYNYRVVMVKQDAELDMRGRCSAGQRGLASIIIRLALAECFGVNCGLIALDEPTTNLDRDNIRSLAEALHNIILTRQQQANFQLIVITHDEEFLKFMKCQEFCESYWRISRNEKMKSVIQRQNVAEVM